LFQSPVANDIVRVHTSNAGATSTTPSRFTKFLLAHVRLYRGRKRHIACPLSV